MPTPPRDRRVYVQVRRQRAKGDRARKVTISEAAERTADPMLASRVSFDVELTEWGDVIYGGAYFRLPARPRAHDFRIPFSLYARLARHALQDRDEGDVQYEIRGGRIYNYDGNMLTDPPTPRRSHTDPRREVDLEEVARIYNSAERAPTQTVARELHLSPRTAERRVADARAAGLLPPVQHSGGAAGRRPARSANRR